jgi:hypothetical protein
MYHLPVQEALALGLSMPILRQSSTGYRAGLSGGLQILPQTDLDYRTDAHARQ